MIIQIPPSEASSMTLRVWFTMMYRQPILFILILTRLSKPRTSFGGLLGFINKISIGGIMCLAARQHTGGTSIPPLLLRRPRTMPRSPRRHSSVVRCPDYREGYTGSLRIRIETLGVREFLLPFADVFGPSRFHPLIRLERNVCLGIFPRHLATTSGCAFTLLVLFSGKPTEISGGPVHYHYQVKNIYFTAYVFPSSASCDVRSYAWFPFCDHQDTLQSSSGHQLEHRDRSVCYTQLPPPPPCEQ